MPMRPEDFIPRMQAYKDKIPPKEGEKRARDFLIKNIPKPESLKNLETSKMEHEVIAALTDILERDGVSGNLCWALTNASTPESMTLRERLLTEGVDKGSVAQGLAGVSTPESMTLRERLLTEGANKDYVASSYFDDGSSVIFMTSIYNAVQ